MTELLQWLSLAILFAIFAGFAFLYIRHGTKVRPDPEHKPGDLNVTQGGSYGGESGD